MRPKSPCHPPVEPPHPARPEPIALRTAEFHHLVRLYLFLIAMFYLIVSVIGILLIPLWVIGPGQWWSARYYRRLKCVLRERELYFRRGVLVRTESTIPLDRITDLTVKEGPLLRLLGLSTMHVETAGTSGATGVGGMSLVGVIDTPGFRDDVLAQRDMNRKAESGGGASNHPDTVGLLSEIRDAVRDIQAHLRVAGAAEARGGDAQGPSPSLGVRTHHRVGQRATGP